MKKLFAVLIAFALVFAACGDGNDNSTTLRIKNESYIEITDVIWNNIAFTDNQNDNSISTGTNVSKNVERGTGYIYFIRKGNSIAVRTGDVVTVEENEQKEFVLTNNTIIVDVNNITNTDTIGMFYKKPQISVKYDSMIINQHGEYNFDNLLVNTTKEVVFVIENSGEADLTFVTVNDNRINLADNIYGVFSITHQPFVAMFVTPGNTTTFAICFSPTIIGNYTASVHIKTNSQNNDDFSFLIKGTGRDYIIGDTGPAGGIIFYDAGAVIDGWRYLEAALVDFSASWGAVSVDLAGTELSVGKGKQNTQIIIETLNQLEETGRAAQLCANLNFGGYSDWFLPSRDELSLLYQNLHKAGLGGFSTGLYWSSSQRRANNGYYVWLRRFSDGSQMDDAMGFWYTRRDAVNSVRAVRSF